VSRLKKAEEERLADAKDNEKRERKEKKDKEKKKCVCRGCWCFVVRCCHR